jgi:hypothetical protein
MAHKYFATVIAPSKRELLNLQKFDVDLFQPTSRINDRKEFVIEGLLSLEEVAKLVESGYQVLVQEESSKRARAHRETVEFGQWIKQMED